MWRTLLVLIIVELLHTGSGRRSTTYKSCRFKPETPYSERRHPLRINGEWVSQSCEIRPGPEFLLRKYKFKGNRFILHQYYFEDPGCSRNAYGVVAEGEFKTQKRSWIVPGGTEVKYTTRNVSVIPYSYKAAKQFKQLGKQCSELSGYTWKLYRKFQLLNFPSLKRKNKKTDSLTKDFDCTQYFNLSFHELQLMRLEIQRHRSSNQYRIFRRRKPRKFRRRRELYVGDIHTDIHKRRTYRPTSYQAALKHVKARKCHVCSQIANSNDFFPPRLRVEKPIPIRLLGDWVSRKCEVRQYGQFLTRHLTFHSDHKSWQGEYNFFYDPFCIKPSFSISVKGSYAQTGESKMIPGAANFNFRLSRLKVTLKNEIMVKNFNHFSYLGCGAPKSWKLNTQQDVTSTGGCALLGISLPNLEFEIVRMKNIHRKLHLYIGQRSTDGAPLSTQEKRPTSFQEPLVKCKDNLKPVKIVSNEIPSFQMLKQESVPTNNGNQIMFYTKYIMLLFIAYYFRY